MSREDSGFYSHKSHENIRNKNHHQLHHHHQINQINNEYPNSLSPLTTSSIDNNIDYYNIDDAFSNNNGNNNNKSNNTSPTSQINYNYPSTPPLSSSSSPSFSRLQQQRINQMNIMNNNNNNFNINVNNNNTNNNFNDNELNRLSPNLPPHDVYLQRSLSNSSDYDNNYYARTDSLKSKGQRNGIVNASSSLSISSTLSSSSTSSSLSSASTNMTSFPSTPITPSSPYPTAPINTTSSNYFINNNNNANNNEPAKINHKSMPAAKTNPLIQIQPHRQNTFPYYNNQNQEEYNVAYYPPIPQTPQTPHTPYSPYSYAPKIPHLQHSFNTNNANTNKNNTTTNDDHYNSKKPPLNYNSHHKKSSHTNIIRDSAPRVPSFTPSTFEFTGAQDIIDKLYESYYNNDEDNKDEDYENPNHNNFNENDDNYDGNSNNINDEVKDNIEIEKEKEDKKKIAMNTLSRNRKREAAVKEIVTTEKTYVEGLRKLVSVFLVPLREDYQKSMSRNVLLTVNKNPMATLDDITLLFGNIEQLLALHEQLLKNLEERYYNWNPKQLISDIFLQIAPFLKMYTIYLKSFPQAISTMERLNNESKEFKKYLLNCQSKPELGGLPFNSFISLPIQRIPRYRLLLEQLFNYTVESHPDYKSLKKCVEQISIIADEVNEKIRDAENQQRVLEIQTQVEGLPTNIIDPARRFIYKGDLFKVMPKKTSSSTKSSYVSTKDVRVHFLFNDLLLFCIEFQGKLLYKGDINLKYAMVRALEEDAADQPFCFQVIVKQNDADRRHTVRANSYDEQVKWIERINAAIYSLNNGILSNSYNSDSQRLMPIK